MLSRVAGLIQVVVLTVIPVPSRDAFIIAWKFPNMLRELIGEGAVNAAFVPVLTHTLEKESLAKFRELVAATFGAMIVLLTIITIAGVALVPLLLDHGVGALAPVAGQPPLDPSEIALRTNLAQWIFPYVFFICLAVFMTAPLFALNHYLTPSWAPALLNLALITACIFFRELFVEPAYALAVGVWLGGAAQLLVQYIALGRIAGVWRPTFRLRHPGLRRMFYLLIPVLFGQAAGEVNRMVDIMFAAALPVGSVSALFYANRLIQLPTSIFGVATAVAILPSISRAGARQDDDQIRMTLLFALRQSYFLVFPAMIGLLILRLPISDLLFGWNTNSTTDVEMIASATLYSGLGLVAFAWVKVCVSGFYAIQNTRTPVIIATFAMIFNILLNFVLVGPLGFRGLALSTTLAFTLNVVLLYAFLCRRYGVLMNRRTAESLLKSTVSGAVMAAAVIGSYSLLKQYLPGDALVSKTVTTLTPILVGAAIYALAARLLRIEELDLFVQLARRKFGRK